MAYVVAYKRHGELQCEADYVGPFEDHGDAYQYLCLLPAIGYAPEGVAADGYKYIIELARPDPLGLRP